MNRLKNEFRFLKRLWATNINSNIEYRFNFILQILFMMLNNVVYILFWVIFFSNFKSINGWEMSDMYLLFSIVTTGYGLSMIFFGNSTRVSEIITTGRLDRFLILPKNPLLHLLSSRLSVRAVGDFAFGILVFGIYGNLKPLSILIWLLSTINTAIILTCFFALSGITAFWIGRSDVLQQQAANGIVTFGMYPQTIYQGAVKLILFSVIPAGMIGYFPVQAVKSLDPKVLAIPAGFAMMLIVFMIAAFYLGLKRYISSSTFTKVD